MSSGYNDDPELRRMMAQEELLQNVSARAIYNIPLYFHYIKESHLISHNNIILVV